jgi:hypothetical protein
MFNTFLKNKQVKISTSNTNNNTTTFANVTGMSFPILASTIYLFQFDVIWQSAATNTGIGLGVNGPASPTFILVRTEIPTSLTAVVQGMQRAYSTGTAGTTIDTINVNCYAKCYGYISNGITAGTLDFQLKSSRAGTQISVMSGTIGRLWRINPSN